MRAGTFDYSFEDILQAREILNNTQQERFYPQMTTPNYVVLHGNNIDILKTYPDNHFDSIVTDPPYGIAFLGKDWDNNTGAIETWAECFRVLKPGGHILAFSAARTYHHLATNIESVGFEIRDQLMWLYGSGFPKAQDIGKAIDKRAGKKDLNYGTTNNNGTAGGINLSFTEDHIGGSRRCNKCKKDVAAQYNCKEDDCGLKYNAQTEDGKKWLGWKTALKPAHEPIVMARKPFKGSTIDNVLTHGVGALNIDATRIPYVDIKDMEAAGLNWNKTGYETGGPRFVGSSDEHTMVEKPKEKEKKNFISEGRFPSNVLGEVEDYQKYFYCPKVSRKERHCGFEQTKGMYEIAREHGYTLSYDDPTDTSVGYMVDKTGKKVPDLVLQQLAEKHGGGNNHPTVKPVELMKYLIKLVTPPNSTVLDPFCGSGSTGMAAVELGHRFIGCELDPNYVEIANQRIQGWYDQTRPKTTYTDLFDE